MNSLPKLKLDWCSYQAAKYACEHWHYSKCMPSFKLVKIGVWENDVFIGVVIYSIGSNMNIGKAYGLKQIEICELTRVALSSHISKTSKIVSLSVKMIHNQSSGIRLIVSYADDRQGHVGTIYQASNWVYVGKIKGGNLWNINGKKLRNRTVSDMVKTQKSLSSHLKEYGGDKHKYLYPLDDEMRKQIEPLKKPYPKKSCVTGIVSSTSTDQVEGGGAIPTVTLQESINVP